MYQYLDLGGNIIIPMYNLMAGIGILSGVLFLDYRIKKNSIAYPVEIDLYAGIVIAIAAGLFGSKLFNLFYNKQNITPHNIVTGGMTYYGGFICGIIAFSIYLLIRKRNILRLLNIAVPSVIAAHAFGRIGCFLGGCCFGKPANTFIGVIFPYNSIPFNFYNASIKIYPVQIFEALFLFVLFAVMVKAVKLPYNAGAYFISYGVFRFFIEYLRGDSRGVLFTAAVSPSQIISAALAAAGIILLLLQFVEAAKQKNGKFALQTPCGLALNQKFAPDRTIISD
jgi:phosphatidylglycerol:prolipoprotein diacylglycerol transferase